MSKLKKKKVEKFFHKSNVLRTLTRELQLLVVQTSCATDRQKKNPLLGR